MEETLGVIAVFYVVPVIVGYFIGEPKDRKGWLWGLLLGWFGVVVVACLKPRYEKRTKSRPLGEDQRWAERVRQQSELDRQRAR
jgi:hypothetical protein